MTQHGPAPAGAPSPAHPARTLHEPSAQRPHDILRITVRIEDREAAMARHGAQTIDALQRYFEDWPSALPQGDGPDAAAPPPIRARGPHLRAPADGGKIQPAPFKAAGRVRIMLGVALLGSLGLWILIVQTIRMVF